MRNSERFLVDTWWSFAGTDLGNCGLWNQYEFGLALKEVAPLKDFKVLVMGTIYETLLDLARKGCQIV